MKAVPIDVINDINQKILRQKVEIKDLRNTAKSNNIKADQIEQDMWDLESLVQRWYQLFPDTEKCGGITGGINK